MITIDGVSRTYGSGESAVHALRDVSLHVEQGSIFGVVGQSGAGKSTLLRCVNALERPDTGTVTVGEHPISSLRGRRLSEARHDIGMVFQHFNLVGNRTVADNVDFALEAVGQPRAKRRQRVGEVLELVGLSHRADHHPRQLSGGQRQRVGIARALAAEPKVLLSDEATSALDPETTRSILDLIKKLSVELDLTVLLITHQMDVVKRICDSAALMEDGAVQETGTLPELITSPGSRIADELFPVGTYAPIDGHEIVDVTYFGSEATDGAVVKLARELDIDVSILGAALETVDGKQVGRTRLAVPGDARQAQAVVDSFHARGLTAWRAGQQGGTA
ncbi:MULTISPECIES: methionine ABC transporter ATP-binding protein [unclassified Brevibacterium]|uniref:methionine ABC transporter ATP-binding protein n=1 Tax=unclassified Brevibacterium TaxID=2614124 RepID=UPI0008A29696|nr:MULTISPECIES: ATP-binding cassette domain-containing protein [unclassified Brevibacterium]OFL68624.1 methionine ABC transporter ATP-binding protein [Brevibacterium sp. HMSC063G07]OFS25807.1 methionine ABC transporter ATP-binding protein [Brevibacterium sp. HMSC07C04]